MSELSILIPVFNRENLIESCIDSIIEQDFDVKYEIIIVDNGSTDRTSSICLEYCKSYPNIEIKYHRNPETIDPFLNFELCLSYANSEYSMFVFSDDQLGVGSLKELWAYIVSKDAELVLPRYYVMGEKEPKHLEMATTPMSGEKALKNYFLGATQLGVPDGLITKTNILRRALAQALAVRKQIGFERVVTGPDMFWLMEIVGQCESVVISSTAKFWLGAPSDSLSKMYTGNNDLRLYYSDYLTFIKLYCTKSQFNLNNYFLLLYVRRCISLRTILPLHAAQKLELNVVNLTWVVCRLIPMSLQKIAGKLL
jgi:glycosyltransferase involved in cell wall biosynthesis